MDSPSVRQITECFIKPKHSLEEAKQPVYLTPWDLAFISVHYNQKGLLFAKPDNKKNFTITDYLEELKHSLAITLVHFYPLSGRLATSKSQDPDSYLVFVDCNNGPGARFIHAAVDLTISDIISSIHVPLVVRSFFDHNRAVNLDGHERPLLTVQVTELVDGMFFGFSMNHCIIDGTSFWHFINTWSEVFQAKGNIEISISRPPIIERWFPEGYGPIISLPFSPHDQFINRFEAPQLVERIFHFSSESTAKLKKQANTEYKTDKISSFQALTALLWRGITRARRPPHNQITSCSLSCNNRSRLNPPLPENYFGNSISPLKISTTAGELLEHNLGWAAWHLHQSVANQTDKKIREWLETWINSPVIYNPCKLFDPYSVVMGSSPRFNLYGNEFGLGKAVAVRSGYANKFSGKVMAFPGHEGEGSVDFEVCLPPDQMAALESDEELMLAVSLFPKQHM